MLQKKSLALALAGISLGFWVLAGCGDKVPANVNTSKILSVEGTVTLMKVGGSPKKATVGSDLLPEMEIKTGPNSRATLQIGDKAVITVEADAVVKMRDMFKDPSSGQENTRVEFKTGKSMVSITKKLAAQDSFDVMTPAAVAGVRGTEFLVDVADQASSKIAVTKGTVAMRQRIAALDDRPATEVPKAVREALQELASQQEVPVRVNQEMAVDKKQADVVNEVVNKAVETAVKKMEEAVKSDATASSKKESLSAAVADIVVISSKKIEEKTKSGEIQTTAAVEMKEETRKQVDLIPVHAPVPVETLKAIPASKNDDVKDVQQVIEKMKAEQAAKDAEKAAKAKAEADKAEAARKEAAAKAEAAAKESAAKAEAAAKKEALARAEAQAKAEAAARAEAQAAAARAEAEAAALAAARRNQAPAQAQAAPQGSVNVQIGTEGSYPVAISADGSKEIPLKNGANKLPTGTWKVHAEKKGFKPFDQTFEVTEGGTASLQIQLTPKLIASERISLLDGTSVTGHVIKSTDSEVTIETENGVRVIPKRKIDEITPLKN